MRRLVVVLAIALAAVGCGQDTIQTRLVSFNYCGNVCAHGGKGGADFVVAEVRRFDATVVVLQEICRSQADVLTALLKKTWGRAALAYATTFDGDAGGANQCPHDVYGMAVIARSLDHDEVVPLPNPGLGRTQIDERKILCADTGEFTACTTHLTRSSNDRDAHTAQVEALATFLTDRARRNKPLIMAGDVNDAPKAFHAVVDSGAYISGGRGLDQVFATSRQFDRLSVIRRSCACSDHDALVITVDQRRG